MSGAEHKRVKEVYFAGCDLPVAERAVVLDRECGGDVNDCRGDLAAAQDLVDGARTKATISTVGFAVGGAALVGGVVLYLTAPAKRNQEVALVPVIGGDAVGVLARGVF